MSDALENKSNNSTKGNHKNENVVIAEIKNENQRENTSLEDPNSKTNTIEQSDGESNKNLENPKSNASEQSVDESNKNLENPKSNASEQLDDESNKNLENPKSNASEQSGDENIENSTDNHAIKNEKTNIAVDEIDEDKLEILRGDAIGDTMYSESYVLSIILEFNKDIEIPLSDEFEKKLCHLWDMTAEKDVIDCLIKNDALDIFGYALTKYSDNRLIEVLLGVFANITCSKDAAIKIMNRQDLFHSILLFSDSSEMYTLMQFMRFLRTIFAQVDKTQFLLCYSYLVAAPDFFENFSFILKSCLKLDVLTLAMDTLSVILYQYHILNEDEEDIKIVIEGENKLYDMLDSIIAAYITYKEKKFKSSDNLELNYDDKIFIKSFFHSVYFIMDIDDENVCSTLNEHSEEILNGLAEITNMLLMYTNTPMFESLQKDVAKAIFVIHKSTSFRYHEDCLYSALKLFFFLHVDVHKDGDDWEDTALENQQYSESMKYLLNCIASVFSKFDNDKIYENLVMFPKNYISILIKCVNSNVDPEYKAKNICRRIKTSFSHVYNTL